MERTRDRKLDHSKIMVNAYPVDLEYLQFVDLHNIDQRRLVDATIDAQLLSVKKSIHIKKLDILIIGTVLWEQNTSTTVIENFRYFQKKCQDIGIPVHFIVGLDKQSILSEFDNCTFIDFFLLRAFDECNKPTQILNADWHHYNKKFLFLMGKSQKPHRIGLLYKLYKQGLLNFDRSIWSFYDDISLEDSKKYLSKDTDVHDLGLFLNEYKRQPDQVIPTNGHYGGFPFDANMYASTNISIVSETHNDTLPWNTEKIYRAILNHHPFLIAGSQGHTQHLNKMGFHTFDEYFSIPEYCNIACLPTRLDAIVDNVKNFDPSMSQIKEIDYLVRQNVQTLYKLVNHYRNLIKILFTEYGIVNDLGNFLCKRISPYYLSWQFYYQTIKDSSWPPCDSIEDCGYLPKHIQDELKTVFKLEF